MTRIDVAQVLKELDGTPLEFADSVCPQCRSILEGKPFTLRLACTTALIAQFRDDQPKGDESVRRYHLAMKIYDNDEVDLSSEDKVLIKSLVAKQRDPLVVGQVWELLEKDPGE